MAKLLLKGAALNKISDPTDPLFQTVYKLQLRGFAFKQVPNTRVNAAVSSQGGTLNLGGRTFVLEFENDQFNVSQIKNFMNAMNAANPGTVECIDYPTWLELTPAQFAGEVSQALPGAQPGMTYAEWMSTNHEAYHDIPSDKYFVGTNAFNNRDVAVSAIAAIEADGVTVISTSQYPEVSEPV